MQIKLVINTVDSPAQSEKSKVTKIFMLLETEAAEFPLMLSCDVKNDK